MRKDDRVRYLADDNGNFTCLDGQQQINFDKVKSYSGVGVPRVIFCRSFFRFVLLFFTEKPKYLMVHK